jgi:hypothetical protein
VENMKQRINQYHVFSNDENTDEQNPIFSSETESEAIKFIKKDKSHYSLKIIKGEIIEDDEGGWSWKQ